MCGIFKFLLCINLSIFSGKIFNPWSPKDSSLTENNTCRPKQIPKYGFSDIVFFKLSKSSFFFKFSIHAPIDPCPGKIILSMELKSSLLEIIFASAPKKVNALKTEKILLAP